MNVVGIDPGERWCGFAQLREHDGLFSARCSVFDTKEYPLTSLINILAVVSDITVVERFQTRNVGHQRMHSPVTAQIIGALRYATEMKDGNFAEVNPSSPEDLQRFPIWPYIAKWRKSWPKPSNTRWSHGLSAWRVLCQYLLMKQPDVLAGMVRRPIARVEVLGRGYTELNDLIAPTGRWRP